MKGRIVAAAIIMFALLAGGGITYFLDGSPSSYRIGEDEVFIYAKGVGKPGDSSVGAAKRAALDNVKAAIIRGVYKENIEAAYVSAFKKVIGPLSFLGIGKKVIRGSIVSSRIDRLSCKRYYKETKEEGKKLMKIVVRARIPIVN